MTMLREAEHTALQNILLSGKVLDLGGDMRSTYRNLFQGTYALTTVNMDAKVHPDINADIEKPLPINNGSFDGVLLINVLEHVFAYQAVLSECARVLVPRGKIVIVVPYLFPYHASPDDYHRYSASALRRALSDFSDIHIEPLGSGVFSSGWILFERLLPSKVQDIVSWVTHPFVFVFDSLFTRLARALGKAYTPSDYALGFVVTAYKK